MWVASSLKRKAIVLLVDTNQLDNPPHLRGLSIHKKTHKNLIRDLMKSGRGAKCKTIKINRTMKRQYLEEKDMN